MPAQIILPAGAWIKIRVDQPLSSDRNRAGDAFSGTLTQPIVADGFVIAHRGQTIEGRVTEAVKAGKAKGTSRLGLELVEVGLADGQQMAVRSQLVEYNGGTSVGRDVAAIGTTTGTGAAIGAAAAGGFGAGMGAIAGAVASGIGVLVTRGRATEIDPETVVTFRTMAPITISTERAPHAFQPVRQTDYESRTLERRPAPQPRPNVFFTGYDPFFWGGPSFWYGPRYSYWGPRYYGGGTRVFIGGGGRGGGRRR
jgi:type IV secretion system protein VirB10